MSIKKYYYCNLCANECKPTDLLCVYWDSIKKNGDSFGKFTFVTNVNATEKHICKSCFNLVYEFVQENKEIIYGTTHI